MIDTHAHIYSDKFNNKIDNILTEAFEKDVYKIYMPNIDKKSINAMLSVEEKYPHNCFAMMGLHPCSVNKYFEKELYLIEDWLNKRDFAAIGEIGIDMYWDTTYFNEQKEVFQIQVEWAKNKQLPIVVHTRNSMQETIKLLQQLNDENLKGIVHCFTGTLKEAKTIIELGGFKLGIGGIVTFKNGGLDEILPYIDMKNIVLETDSPYLAPVPYRGRINKPAYIPIIASQIGKIKNLTTEEVSILTDKNVTEVYHI